MRHGHTGAAVLEVSSAVDFTCSTLATVRDPDGSKHDPHNVDESRDSSPGQLKAAGLQVVVERTIRYQHRPQNQHIIHSGVRDAVHQAKREQERHFSDAHAVADVVQGVQCRRSDHAWHRSEAGAEPGLNKASEEDRLEETGMSDMVSSGTRSTGLGRW
jgi:hypothetical protein